MFKWFKKENKNPNEKDDLDISTKDKENKWEDTNPIQLQKKEIIVDEDGEIINLKETKNNNKDKQKTFPSFKDHLFQITNDTEVDDE